jgi:hypothetical protein
MTNGAIVLPLSLIITIPISSLSLPLLLVLTILMDFSLSRSFGASWGHSDFLETFVDFFLTGCVLLIFASFIA